MTSAAAREQLSRAAAVTGEIQGNAVGGVDAPDSFHDEATRSEALAPSPLKRRRTRLTREELAPEARDAIFRAAMQVVGENGYANTSIERVTKTAGIAQGTFYLYFESRQALFDQLLPYLGAQLLEFIRNKVRGSGDIYAKEERGFRAFFGYMKVNPGFFRLLTEAPGAAPQAHARHFEQVTTPYVNALGRAMNAGDIKGFAYAELEAVAYMLMSAREYLYMRYIEGRQDDDEAFEKVVHTYMKFVKNGLSRE